VKPDDKPEFQQPDHKSQASNQRRAAASESAGLPAAHNPPPEPTERDGEDLDQHEAEPEATECSRRASRNGR